MHIKEEMWHPGAYLNANMAWDKFILLKIEVKSVDIMCKVNPEQKKKYV